MKTKEIYDSLRGQKSKNLGLRARLTLFVLAEILVCILLSWGFDLLVGDTIFDEWEGTFLVELLIISLIVGSIATSFMSIYFFNPIKHLRTAMASIADGDFSVRLETNSTSKEIKEVYAGFNMMARELASTEILQSDFVSNVSHEIKTPVNAIEGYTTLLQGCDSLDDEQSEYIEKILFNTKRLSTLVGNILLLSKIENQNIRTGKNLFSLDEQIRQSVVSLETAWSEKDINLDIDLERIDYNGNENLMMQVWNNLIGNAIKFSPQGGCVGISLFKKEGKVIFEIADEGIGLSDEDIKHIFDKFYQGDSSHKQEGNGLGLALVKRILAIEGGEIKAKNRTDRGCVFTVTLRI